MSWVQATLLARGLCRAWGGICGAALPGTSISQVPLPKDSTGAADPPQPHIVGSGRDPGGVEPLLPDAAGPGVFEEWLGRLRV
uniref:ECSIT signaling integrator n=2 Tax=Cercopithecinae TaxID=9528 RepID=A0A2K5XVY1_MANLE